MIRICLMNPLLTASSHRFTLKIGWCTASLRLKTPPVWWNTLAVIRAAISNNRIISMDNGMVTFKWRDYRNGNQWKVMILLAAEFIRCFLIHVLPDRFMKIRHYKLLGNLNKTERLAVCKKLTLTGKDVCLCPHCGVGKMLRSLALRKAPPLAVAIS